MNKGGERLTNLCDFKKDLLEKSLEDVYLEYIVAGPVWYFVERFGTNWFNKYNEFKVYIATKLNIHYNDIAIAGSAKLGFSINPQKKFKMFDERSDIDVVVVSQKLYYKFWNSYLNDSYSPIRIKKYSYICTCIFRKFISFEGFNESNNDYMEWKKQTLGFEKDLQLRFGIRNEIHYRIFESWDAAKSYYIAGMEKNKERMKEEDGNN